MWDFRTIVAAIDFSEHSEEVLRVAGALAGARFSELHIVYVVTQPAPEGTTTAAAAAATTRLEGLSPTITTATRVVRRVLVGTPADEITRYASEHHAHLIVIGTHGYGPVRRLFVGSVARRVLRQAHCAVLTVPPRDSLGSSDEIAGDRAVGW